MLTYGKKGDQNKAGQRFQVDGNPLRRNKVNRDFVSVTAQPMVLMVNSDVCIIPDRVVGSFHRPFMSLHCQHCVLQAVLVA